MIENDNGDDDDDDLQEVKQGSPILDRFVVTQH